MTASLFLLMSLALFAATACVCFIGCGLDDSGELSGVPQAPPFADYTNKDIFANPNCIAYWPLDDSTMQTTAIDSVGKAKGDPHNGEYRSKGNFPSLFPCPDYTLDPNTPVDSAFAPGDVFLQYPGIVAGNTYNNDYNSPAPAIVVNGGFVHVPYNKAINPPDPFSVELWARLELPPTFEPAYRAVIDARNQANGQFFGFSVFVNQQGNWEGQVGGTGNGNYATVPGPKADPGTIYHVVLRVTDGKAVLFVNGVASTDVSLPAGSSFAPNDARPLVIGVGAAYLPDRTSTDPSEYNRFPLLPFSGTIECVALYDAGLSDIDIQKHYDNGRALDFG